MVYLHDALDRRLATGVPLRQEDVAAAVIEGAVQRLRPKLRTVCTAVILCRQQLEVARHECVAGTLVGCSVPAGVGEICTWAIYNFVVFAVLPYLWFRRRYSAAELNLRSTNRVNDLLVIVVVGVIESFFELGAFHGIFHLSAHQLVVAVPLSVAVFMIGTVLPTMVLIYAILVPRYLKLTGSFTTTVLLGGVTYAAMHLVEGWSLFTTPRNAVLSLIFVVLGYTGPGMIKTFMTLRTGNAWVHAIGYAIAPHVVVDAPLIAKAFGLR